jgi:pimeloyl-ACP methyl ester carboxylesterase
MSKNFTALIAGLTMAGFGAPSGASALNVSQIGGFHVGGRTASVSGLPVADIFVPGVPFPLKDDPNGDYKVDQMYVQYVKLAKTKAKYPLLFIHGGGMTGVTYETTPDGRPGWQTYFLEHGHDVYVADSVERGRAGFARPEIWKGHIQYPTAKGTWELARIGPIGSYTTDAATRKAYPGGQFPTTAFDQLLAERVPSWGRDNEPAVQAAYDLLVQKICPCVIIAHSTGGTYAQKMALHAPGKVKGVILLEPASAPDPKADDAASLKAVPHLYIWADFLKDDPVQSRVMPVVETWRAALAAAGGKAVWVDLPKVGITGNSHMMMMEKNSDQVAGLLQDWMTRSGLMKTAGPPPAPHSSRSTKTAKP